SGPGGSPGGLATLRGEAQMQLARSLQEQGNAEIVRSARLIVRGNDSGEIRLTLRPESLGNVRISLQMQDGHIAGRIIVDNQSVREVFEQNMAALERAFHEGGLETGLLDVSVADSGNQSHGAHERAHSGASSGHRVAERFDASVVSAEFIDSDYGLINMVV
ncbi:MAG: flagellar hook-length control protein FliK, partial [Spirochaetaceae bacterium]